MGTAALAVSERIPQSRLHNPAHKRQAEQLPRRHRQAGAGAHGKAHRADETDAGYHRAAKGGKRLRMGAENEQHTGVCKRDCGEGNDFYIIKNMTSEKFPKSL